MTKHLFLLFAFMANARRIVPVCIFSVLTVTVFAQSIGLQVIGVAGDHFTTTAGQVTFTVGEAVIQTAPGIGSISLPQGFHQHMVWKVISAAEPEEAAFNIRVFPNPFSAWLRIETDRPVLAVLFDPLGRPVSPPARLDASGDIQLQALPAGFYVLRLTDPGGRLLRVFKLHQIQ